MPIDITSANSKLRIVVPSYYPGGFDVDDYAADNMFETGALQNKETQMSADGKFHAGFVFNPTEFTITPLTKFHFAPSAGTVSVALQ